MTVRELYKKWDLCGNQTAVKKVKSGSDRVQERSGFDHKASTQEPGEAVRILHGRRWETPYLRVHAQ